jgi:hypothetical protein
MTLFQIVYCHLLLQVITWAGQTTCQVVPNLLQLTTSAGKSWPQQPECACVARNDQEIQVKWDSVCSFEHWTIARIKIVVASFQALAGFGLIETKTWAQTDRLRVFKC